MTELEAQGAGFEFQGKFYPWRVSDTGKDLLLIDRITGMAVNEFFELIEDDQASLRGSMLLAMIATSIRAGNPNWTVDRICRLVMDLSLSEDIQMVGGEDDEELPPLSGGKDEEHSTSPAAVSSPSSIQEDS